MLDLSSYRELYLETAEHYLNALKTNFLLLQMNPEDFKAKGQLHISAHSLKSQSLVMGYESTGLLCKELEFIFRAIKEGQLQINTELKSAITQALKKLEASLTEIKDQQKEADLTEEKKLLQTVSGIAIN